MYHLGGVSGAINSDTNPVKLGLCLIYFTSRIIRINGGAAVVIFFAVRFRTRLSHALLWFDAQDCRCSVLLVLPKRWLSPVT